MRAQAATSLRAAAHLSAAASNKPLVAVACPSAAPSPIPNYIVATRSSSVSQSTSAPPKTSQIPSSKTPEAPKGPLKDDQITSPYVRLVDPKSGALAGPFPTSTILTKLDRSKFFLLQVAPPQPDRTTIHYDPSSSPPPPGSVDVSALVQFPICKLIDKKEEFDKLRNLKRQKSSSSSSSSSSSGSASAVGSSKEVQLTWSVTPNDLSHKLSKAKKEMLKGARINLIVTTKRGGRKYIKGYDAKEDARREELLARIEDFLCSPDAKATEGIEMEGEEKGKGEGRIARRLQEVDWQRGGSAAVMPFECFRK